MSRDWLLFLDDLVASAEKVGRLTAGHDLWSWSANEAAHDAVLFNLQVIGEAIKQFPAEQLQRLPERQRTGPARLRDLIAHHYFAIDPEIIWDVALNHVPELLTACRQLRAELDGDLA
ncbi:MAG: hypothetical protein RL722_1376 [Pseudomonadota bacterium]